MGDLVDHLLALEGPLALEGVGHDEDGDMATVRIAIRWNHLQLNRLERCGSANRSAACSQGHEPREPDGKGYHHEFSSQLSIPRYHRQLGRRQRT